MEIFFLLSTIITKLKVRKEPVAKSHYFVLL